VTSCRPGLSGPAGISGHPFFATDGNLPRCLRTQDGALPGENGRCGTAIAKKMLARANRFLYYVFSNF
jgi:hypothetical protein